MAWGDRPYALKKGRHEAAPFTCPVCWLIRGNEVRLELIGKREPVEDRPCECPWCRRRWESVRFFLYGWCPLWVPKIESELHVASGIDGVNDASFQESEEREWKRANQVREAVEKGWWNPRVPDDLSIPTERELAHFDPNVHVPTRERNSRTQTYD